MCLGDAESGIMKPALRDFDCLRAARAGDAIDQPMLFGDAARPPAFVVASQRLWLAEADKWPPTCVRNQRQNFRSDLRVLLHPVREMIERIGVENGIHSAASR